MPCILSKKNAFLFRERYNIGQSRSVAEEDRGLELQDSSSCASALVDCVVT